MQAIPTELDQELKRLFAALQQDLGVTVTSARPLPGALHASLRDGVMTVPSQYIAHWKRFGIMPTALVRDVAYSCKRHQLEHHPGLSGAQVEADAMAYAERFLRAATDGPED